MAKATQAVTRRPVAERKPVPTPEPEPIVKRTPPAAAKKPTTTAIEAYDDLEAESGRGLEGTDKDSFAIPFLQILQKGSPQCDPDSGAYIKGAAAGQIYNTVTGELHSGKTGMTIIPCAYQRRWVRWGARNAGGGFKGELLPEQVAQMRVDGELKDFENKLFVADEKGAINPKRSDLVADTRNHFVLVVDKNGAVAPALLALGSTQIKKSRSLNTALQSFMLDGKGGKKFNPPTYAVQVLLSTVPESNDKGSWHGAKFTIIGRAEPDQIAAGRNLHDQVTKGTIATTPPPSASPAASDDDDSI